MNENVLPFKPRPDAPPTPIPVQREFVLNSLTLAGEDGVIWKDLSVRYGWHHGSASGVLSRMHKADQVARLKDKRDGCHIYVSPVRVAGRETHPYAFNSRNELLVDMAAFIQSLPACTHTDDRIGRSCRGCQRYLLLFRYDEHHQVQ